MMFLPASLVRIPKFRCRAIARCRTAFPPLNQADKPLCHQEPALAYLSGGNDVSGMPAGIKKARMASRINEARRRRQRARISPRDISTAHDEKMGTQRC